MKPKDVLGVLMGSCVGLFPAVTMAQNINVTRSIFEGQPYTLIYPEVMVASGGAGEPVTINHPDAPLQCALSIVPVDDTNWTAENALSSLNDADVTAAWIETLPGFTLGTKGVVAYQDAPALSYEGTSSDSSMGVPLTLVHTETVAEGRGYTLDCFYATSVANKARPIVDFIISNFATRSDAECCVAAEAVEPEPGTAPQ